jgi:hypothetical protein
MDEFYDLHADPYELRNVIDDARYGDAVEAMRLELQRLLGSTP